MADTLELFNAVNGAFLTYPPIFQAFQAAAQSVPNGFAGVAMIWTTPTVDSYGGWSGGTPSRYTPQTPGWYYITGQIGYTVNTTGARVAQLQKNGLTSGSFATSTNGLSTSNFTTNLQSNGAFLFNGTTDYVELWGYQDSGAGLNTMASLTSTTIYWLHA